MVRCKGVPVWAALSGLLAGAALCSALGMLAAGVRWHEVQWVVALLMVCATLPISLHDITQHVCHMHNHQLQVPLIRILWMVPVYAVDSFLALKFQRFTIVISIAREMYEAFVIYSFVLFLFRFVAVRAREERALSHHARLASPQQPYCPPASPAPGSTPSNGANDDEGGQQEEFPEGEVDEEGLGDIALVPTPAPAPPAPAQAAPLVPRSPPPQALTDEEMVRLVKAVLNEKQPLRHSFPFCFARRWPMSGRCEFFDKCRRGVAQYVVWRVVASLVACVLELTDRYKEGDLSGRSGYVYIAVVFNVSQCWALYCLVMVYRALQPELAPMRPLLKFLCVKSVVFFSWYQSFFIYILVEMGAIEREDARGEAPGTNLQNFLICVEMFLAALVHHVVFPFDAPYLEVGSIAQRRAAPGELGDGVHKMLDVKDIAYDARDVTDSLKNSLVVKSRAATRSVLQRTAPKSQPRTPGALQ